MKCLSEASVLRRGSHSSITGCDLLNYSLEQQSFVHVQLSLFSHNLLETNMEKTTLKK